MRQRRLNEGVVIREEDIQQFLADYERINHTEGTVQFYRRKMRRFYEDLPEDKTVRHGTLQECRTSLLQNIALLVEQAMERMMEQEQFSIGWEES